MNIINVVNIYDKRIECISFSDSKQTIVFEKYIDFFYFEEIEKIIPKGFYPQIIIFWHPEYYFVPVGIENSKAFTLACVGDWNLNFINLLKSISRFDYIITDFIGNKTLKNFGFKNVDYFPIYSLPHHTMNYSIPDDIKKEYDIVFIGSLNEDIQVERTRFLYKIAMLADKYKVLVTTQIYGQEYFDLLAKSKIVFNRSIRKELNIRVFEAFLTKSLLFLEQENEEYRFYLKDKQELVIYNDENIEELIDFYIENDNEREKITDNAYKFLQKNSQKLFKNQLYEKIINIFKSTKQDERKFNLISDSEKKIISHEEAFITLDEKVYSKIDDNFTKILYSENDSPEICNNIAMNLYKNNSESLIQYLKNSVEKFPLNFILRLNFLSIIHKKDKKAAKNFIFDSIKILETEEFKQSDFEGILFDERYSRFKSEYERIFYSLSEKERLLNLKNLFLWRFCFVYAEIFFEECNFVQSLYYYQKADNILTNVNIKKKIGDILRINGDFSGAYNYYIQGFKESPFHLQNWYALVSLESFTYYKLDKPENREWITIIESSPIFDPLIKDFPEYTKESLNRKHALLNVTNNKRLKISLLEKILKSEPENNELTFILGKLLFEAKKYHKAINLFAKILTTKKDKEIIFFLAESLKAIGDQNTFTELLSKSQLTTENKD